jgi:eukaryotic-like serine/threonine-protein kinase
MDYVAGPNLAEVVGNHPLPARRAATYLLKIVRAVQCAHDHGILHRDLKPANILIDEQDEPRITDFGLARCLTDDSDLTLTNQVLGSPNFMPPEQGRGGRQPLSPASDLYSLGAVLYSNPHPDSEVQSIDFDAPPSGLAPFLVAITVEL